MKKYLPKALSAIIIQTQETPEQHTRKEVQLHHLARKFALQLAEKVRAEELNYGTTFQYNMVFMGKTDLGGYVTVEEYIQGEFVKYINNNGDLGVKESTERRKAESLVHFVMRNLKDN